LTDEFREQVEERKPHLILFIVLNASRSSLKKPFSVDHSTLNPNLQITAESNQSFESDNEKENPHTKKGKGSQEKKTEQQMEGKFARFPVSLDSWQSDNLQEGQSGDKENRVIRSIVERVFLT
jgi:hypothetical protein